MQLGHAPLAQLDRVAHYECEGWGFESLMARQTETLIERWVFLFVCISIKGTRTRKSRCVRENVRWTFDQQRVQACTACAERRMRSIRASPSWRARNVEITRFQRFTFFVTSKIIGFLAVRFCMAVTVQYQFSVDSICSHFMHPDFYFCAFYCHIIFPDLPFLRFHLNFLLITVISYMIFYHPVITLECYPFF